MSVSRVQARLITALLCALVGVLALPPPVAHADGDPASDVLLSANVFFPYEPAAGSAERTLDRVSAALVGRHDTVKVAIIATSRDLGAVSSLFDRPAAYAEFVDVELSYSGPPQMLVVMPDGYGTSHLSPAARAAVARLPRAGSANATALVRAAIRAELSIARADGHPIPASVATSTQPSRSRAHMAPRHRSESPLRLVLIVLLATAAVGGAVVLVLTSRGAGRPSAV